MRLASLAAAAALFACATAHAQSFDRDAWAADFDQLKAAITQGSPNLEWQAERGLDFPALEARARARLAAAHDDSAARGALERFVRAFADGHMDITWPAASVPNPETPALRNACADLGFWTPDDGGAIATRLPSYESVAPPDAYIPAGVAPVGGHRLGVIRISLFAPSAEICARVLAERAMAPDAPCDEACGEAVSNRANDLFLAEIAERIGALRTLGADALLLDVAANGGGNDTSIAIARMLAGVDTPSPAMAVLRSEARAEKIAADRDVLRAGLAHASSSERTLLRRLIAQLDTAQEEALHPCDQSALWSGARPACSQLVRGFFAGGLIAEELPAASRDKPWADYVSATARLHYTPSLWSGPLLVLIDGYSASSTELLAAMLQDSERAIIVGAPSYGAGCGWNLPHEDVALAHSGGRLSLPNCARFRRDGSNEIDGVQPDVLVGLRTYDTPAQRAARLAVRLPAAINAALSARR